MNKYKELEKLILSMSDDVNKFYLKGNSSAALRVRKSLQLVKSLAQELRKDISENKKK